MANLLGLGVFGTFGQSYGFQQAFSQDVRFSRSLDLDSNEIELFPGTELFAVRREVVRGVYSISFCMYTYIREMNANRSTTFLGSCIVLQQVYIEPDKIYKLLRELQEDLVNSPQNVNNNTIQARQVTSLVVTEPSQLQSAKFSTKSIDDTPYYSTKVDPGKKYFIQTEHIESASQVISFFEEALKNFNDVDSLYFTFSDKVIDSVMRKGGLKVINWDDFVDHKNQVQQDMVTSKKGLRPVAATVREEVSIVKDEPVPVKPQPQPAPSLPPVVEQTETVIAAPIPVETVTNEDAKPINFDSGFPFVEWEEPNSPWSMDEQLKKVHEYNRLVAFAKHLQVWNDDYRHTVSDTPDSAVIEEKKPEPAPTPQPQQKQTFFGEIPINNSKQEREDEMEHDKKPFYKKRVFLIILVLLLGIGGVFLVKYRYKLKKHFADSPATTQVSDTTKPVVLTHDNDAASPQTQSAAGTDNSEMPSQTIKSLSPQPNGELNKSEVSVITDAGVRGRHLPEIVSLIFQKYPATVGEVYKHQFTDYSMSLLMANRYAFQKSGADYVCIADTILHIPAYKSQKPPVTFPK